MATTLLDRPDAPRVNSKDKVSPRPRPETPAHVVKSDAEAIEIAHRLADKFAEGAALRDREGLLPLAELGVGTRVVRNRTLRSNGSGTHAARRSPAGRRSDLKPSDRCCSLSQV
jgi:hypothetical protein